MKLVIGGYAQGKLSYVLSKYHLQEDAVWDGALPDKASVQKETVVINHFHNWVKNCILEGGCPEAEMESFLKCYKNCIIISDEIGNGIVPTDSFEREYREHTGRLLVRLAENAEEVWRIICGIGQRIK